MISLFELHSASLVGEASILRSVDWSVARGRATAIVGPSGTGKSVLLATLAARDVDGVRRTGDWRFDGGPHDASVRERVNHVPQRAPVVLASEGDARPLLVDEPERFAGPREALVTSLRAQASRTLVFVSHDLELVRSVADRVVLLCAGAIVADADTGDFFERPASELAARFVQQGNCWPRPTPPALPPGFRWVLPGRLAGMPKPGLLRDAEEDLASIAHAGVGTLVSLTEEPFPPARLRAFGIEAIHLPIRDMDVPAIGRAADLCRRVQRKLDAAEVVAMHCHAGLGRTGTLLAALLVWQGATSVDALAKVRAVEPRMVQNAAQERFVAAFADAFGPRF